MLFRLALRNVLRQKMRSALSVAALIAGVWVMIVGRGFVQGFKENIIRASEDSLTAHVLVRQADYPVRGLQHPLDALITLTPQLKQVLDTAPHVTERTLFVGTAIYGTRNMRVRGVGFDPITDPQVFPRDTWRVKGIVPTNASQGVMVGQGVATLLGLAPGQFMVLQARVPEGAMNALTVPIAGVYTTGNVLLDNNAVFVPKDLTAVLLNTPQRSHLAIRLADRYQAAAFAERLQPLVRSDQEVVTWKQETQALVDVQQIRQNALNLLVLVLVAMSALGIANTLLMAAYERIAEIGTLRAMGMPRTQVVGLFLIEGGLIGVFAGGLGAILGALTTYYFATMGIDLSASLKNVQTGNLPIAAMLYTEYSSTMVLLAWAFGLTVAVLASIYPALVASRQEPADAVRAS